MMKFKVEHPVFEGLEFEEEKDAILAAENACWMELKMSTSRADSQTFSTTIQKFSREHDGKKDVVQWWFHSAVSVNLEKRVS